MPIKLKKYDIQNKINNPKEGYMILGFDENGVLVFKDSSGGYRTVVDVVSTGYFERLNVNSGLTIGSRLANSYEGLYSIAQGKDIIASGESSLAQGSNTEALSNGSTARGEFVVASGLYSYISGKGSSESGLTSGGINSFVHSYSDNPLFLGTYGDFSVILGGINHNITSNGTNSAIIGGVGVEIDSQNTVVIAVSGLTNTISDAVYVPRIVLVQGTYDTPPIGTIEFRGGRLQGFASGYTSSGGTWIFLDEDSEGPIDQIAGWISSESVVRASQDTSISSAISSEIIIRASQDTSISNALSSEIITRTSVNTYIQSQVPLGNIALTPILSADILSRISYDNSLSTAISSGDLSLSTMISAESSSRSSADSSITTNIINESTNRNNGDVSLTASISSADASLSSLLSTEASNRNSGDLSLSTALSSNISVRSSRDLSLSTALSSDISIRISADFSLSTAIDSESTPRSAADSSLSTVIGSLIYSPTYIVSSPNQTLTDSLNALNVVFGTYSGTGTYNLPFTTGNHIDFGSPPGTNGQWWFQVIAGRMFIDGWYMLGVSAPGWNQLVLYNFLRPYETTYHVAVEETNAGSGQSRKVPMKVETVSSQGKISIRDIIANVNYHFSINYYLYQPWNYS